MPATCPTCSRVNPSEALYCYHDGAALGNHAGRGRDADPTTRPFPGPFVFPSGQACRNFNQLALACLDNWSTASELLQQGVLAQFLGGLGRADLVQAARVAARNPDHDRALDDFLGKLPTSVLAPPALRVEPAQVNLGTLTPDKDLRWELRLQNQGMGLLHGSVNCEDCPWLTLGDGAGGKRKLFQLQHDSVIPVHVRAQHLRAGNKPLEARLVIESNGGTTVVTVGAEVPIRPFAEGVLAGARSPRQVAEKARDNPKGAAVLFEQGAVARWYKDNGWSYPVQGPSASGVAAVQQFFEALGLTAPPKVEISEEAIRLTGNPGEPVDHTLQVRTAERRPVYAHAVSNQAWLQVERIKPEGRSVSIYLKVPTVPHTPGETLNAKLTVQSNGNQRFVVPVTLQVSGRARSSPPPPVYDLVDAVRPGQGALAVPVWNHSPGAAVPVLEAVDAPVVEAVRPAPNAVAVAAPYPAVAVVAEAADEPRPHRSWLEIGCLPLVPVAFLMLGLFVTLVRDAITWVARPALVLGGTTEVVDTTPRIELRFHDQAEKVMLAVGGSVKPGAGRPGRASTQAVWEPSMRFGLATTSGGKLTFEKNGTTNNTCLRIDGSECLFGERPFHSLDGRYRGPEVGPPGRWVIRDAAMPGGHQGKKALWLYEQPKIQVTQTVEIVPNPQSGLLDTCLVHYLIENQDVRPHTVGLRFLLDTFIGNNDGVPFLIPGQQQMCSTSHDFRSTAEVPDFIQALEHENLSSPGTIAQVHFKVAGLEPPSRVTLGAWPNPDLNNYGGGGRCRQEKTLWDVPVLSIKTLPQGDSAVTMYWHERLLPPGSRREVGFAYGLGSVASREGGGKLALSVGGSFTPGGEFTVTAYVNTPQPGQSVTLTLPAGFPLIQGGATQSVPPLPPGAATRNSPVTWKVRAGRAGSYKIEVRSSTGATQSQPLKIRERGIFGN